MEAGLLVYGEYERIDALEAGASRASVLETSDGRHWRSVRAQLQACGGPELATAGGHRRARRGSAPDAVGRPREIAVRGERRSSARRQVIELTLLTRQLATEKLPRLSHTRLVTA